MNRINAGLVGAACAALPFFTQPALADPTEIEEVVVVAEQDTRIFELAETVDVVPDSAQLLKRAVGANVVSNGPLSGIAQYRGMSRYRLTTQVNGAIISAGGPNWMDPPLSYAPAAHLESLEVFRGIASVSAGQETFGGVIRATTWQGDFSDEGLRFEGRTRAGGQSVNNGRLLSAAASLANETHLVTVSALHEYGDDAEFADGSVVPTEYERDRYDLGYGIRWDRHLVRLSYGRNKTGDAGTPALPMDIEYIDSDLFGLSWDFEGESMRLRTKLHASEIDHGMTNYHLRRAPMAGGMWRRNVTGSDNRGFAVVLEAGAWSIGVDGHEEVHFSDIGDPNNPRFFVTNFDDAERRVLGVFTEREFAVGDAWMVEAGLRVNRVDMDSDRVNATPAMMGMAPAVALRDRFNAADRSQTDVNVDWVVKLNYAASAQLDYYAGVSRKTRSPSYQERYLWLPLQATAGLADGRTYTGNVDLSPEVAHEVEFGVDWRPGRFTIAPRIFYRDVSDYVQGTESSNGPALMFVQMMNRMNGTNNAAPLEFNNVDATFYGFDIDWSHQITERWSVEGVVNFVRGERDDIDDDLYRVAPTNAFVALNYATERWGISLESALYDAQDNVSETNGEVPSDGYTLFDLKGHWLVAEGLRLGYGVTNLTDRDYADHLAGINRVMGSADLAPGERLPGYGRSLFARLDYRW